MYARRVGEAAMWALRGVTYSDHIYEFMVDYRDVGKFIEWFWQNI